MKVWQANLGRGVSADEFTANLRRILDAGGRRSVYCFQEIDEADAPEEFDILWSLTRKTHQVVGERTAVPILIPRHLAIVGQTQTLAANGLAKFTPNRVINEASIALGPNLTVGVLNTHLPINRPQTMTRRAQVRKSLRARARRHDSGIWVADTNSAKWWPTIVNGEVDVINAGIDKSKAWAGEGREVVVSERRKVSLTIDGHDAHGARVRWERT